MKKHKFFFGKNKGVNVYGRQVIDQTKWAVPRQFRKWYVLKKICAFHADRIKLNVNGDYGRLGSHNAFGEAKPEDKEAFAKWSAELLAMRKALKRCYLGHSSSKEMSSLLENICPAVRTNV